MVRVIAPLVVVPIVTVIMDRSQEVRENQLRHALSLLPCQWMARGGGGGDEADLVRPEEEPQRAKVGVGHVVGAGRVVGIRWCVDQGSHVGSPMVFGLPS
jgi:hypothetical protein